MSRGRPDFMVSYLAERDAQRASAVKAFLAQLTPRERGLFHDAAVMGYVQGLMRDRTEDCPKDSQVMALVVDACLALPDLYPAVNAVQQDDQPAVTALGRCGCGEPSTPGTTHRVDGPCYVDDLDRCPAAHGALGRLCKLPTGHPGMHIGSGPNGGAAWFGDAS